MSDPGLHTITISEGNAVGITPGVYVSVDDLTVWLENRKLPKTAQELRKHAIDGESSEVKYGTIGRSNQG